MKGSQCCDDVLDITMTGTAEIEEMTRLNKNCIHEGNQVLHNMPTYNINSHMRMIKEKQCGKDFICLHQTHATNEIGNYKNDFAKNNGQCSSNNLSKIGSKLFSYFLRKPKTISKV